jgi:hypothetical protein
MILALLRSIDLPGIHLSRGLQRGQVLAMSSDTLIEEAAKAFEHLYRFLCFVEGGRLRDVGG